MPAKQYVYLQGKCKWCRHRMPEHDPFGNVRWSVELIPTPESLAIIRDLQKLQDGVQGIKNTLRQTDDGYIIRFGRPQNKTMRGTQVAFTPPEARDKNGLPMGDVNIGNGSDVTIKLEVYKHKTPLGKQARAVRWEAIQVDNLVPYDTHSDYKPEENKAFEGMDKIPIQTISKF